MRDRNGYDLYLLERLAVTFHRRADGLAIFYDLGKVIPGQPRPGMLIIPRKNDASSGHTRHFAQSPGLIRPMMHGEYRKRRVECIIVKGQSHGRCTHDRRGAWQSLSDHDG